MSVSVKDSMLTIKGEDVDLFKAIQLKNILENMLDDGCKSAAVSLVGVKNLSGTAYQVLSTIGNRFDKFQIISSDDSIKQRFSEAV